MPTTGLGAALKDFEKYKMAAFPAKPKSSDLRKAIAALKALQAVETARKKGVSLCGNVLFYDTKTALQKTQAITTASKIYVDGLMKEITWIEDSVEKIPTYMSSIGKAMAAHATAPKDKKDAFAKSIKLDKDAFNRLAPDARSTVTDAAKLE